MYKLKVIAFLISIPIVILSTVSLIHKETIMSQDMWPEKIFIGKTAEVEMSIDSIHPQEILQNQDFNLIQGQVALSIIGNNFKEQDKIYINDKLQVTAFGSSTLLTCLVDKELYKEEGILKIQVERELKDGASPIVTVPVEIYVVIKN